MDNKPAIPQTLKSDNRKFILDLLRKDERMSIGELSAATGLSRTTVMKALQHFCDLGYAYVAGKGASTLDGGKKPEIFAFGARSGYICALSIHPLHTFGGMTDLSGRLLLNMRMPHAADENVNTITENMAKMIRAAAEAAGLSPDKLHGVAVGCDGLVDAQGGIVYHAKHFPSWGEIVPMADLVRVSIGKQIPVAVDNALLQLGLGEIHADGELYGKRVVTVFHGESVSASLLQPDKNARMTARSLELGRMLIQDKNYGELSNGKAVMRRAKYKGWTGCSLPKLFEAANRGDALARLIMDETIALHVQALYNVMLLCDPDVILLQGDYAKAGVYFYTKLREQLSQMLPVRIGDDVEIRPSILDINQSFLIGAAMSMIEKIFDDSKIYDL